MARSRRTTPSAQSAVPASTAPLPARTRSTRSATHEAPATQPATTSTRTRARAKSTESNTSNVSRGSKGRGRLNAPKEVPAIDLSTVQEDLDDEDDNDADLFVPAPDGQTQAENDAVGDQSLHSMSGTTAREYQSEDEDASNFDVYRFLAYAPDAYRAASVLMQRFDRHKQVLLQILRSIDHADSSNATEFQQDVEALNDAMARLGDDFVDKMIPADQLMDVLFGGSSQPNMTSGCWHLVEMVQALNIGYIVRNVAGPSEPTKEILELLDQLDGQFASPFLKDVNMEDSAPIVGNTSLADATFDAALAIRLQNAVHHVQQNYGKPDFDLTKYVQKTFFASEQDRSTLCAWTVNALGAGDLGLLPEYEAKMRRRIRQFENALQSDIDEIADGSQESIQILLKNFPWIDFRTTLLQWAKERMNEIAKSVEGIGGIDELITEVKHELSKSSNFDFDFAAAQPSPQSPAKGKAKTTPRSSARYPSVGMPASSPHSPVSARAAQQITIHDDSQLTSILRAQKEHQRQQKENRRERTPGFSPPLELSPARPRAFIDPQEGAEKITSFSQATQSQRSGASRSRSRFTKRKAVPVEDDVSEDDGPAFESDQRHVDQSQRRRDAPQPGPSPSKRVRITEPGPSSARSRAADEDDRVAEYAKQKHFMSTQAARAMQVAPRRPALNPGRVRWDDASELRLQQMVSEHGCSWAYIKSLDEQNEYGERYFEGRDQVALKDKARNMKTALLLAHVELPRNWEKVPLSKKEKERLIKAGIDGATLLRAGVEI